MLFCCHSSCAEKQLQDSESSSCRLAASALLTPSPLQSPKEKKLKVWPKIYVL
jgi:hypothetical protein